MTTPRTVLAGSCGAGTGRLVLLLHGLGGNAGVWAGLTPWLAGRRWWAPDLPGHGLSPALTSYGYREVAAVVAAQVADEPSVVVLGHSFGAAVGLALAGLRPCAQVVSVGLRADWPDTFVATLAALAGKPTRWFDDPAEAASFLLHVNGLTGLVDRDGPFVVRGLRQLDGRFGLRADPRAFALPAPPFHDLLTGLGGTPVTMAHGSEDVMISGGDYARFGAYGVRVEVLAGRGHNAHVEDPAAVAALLV